MLSTRHLATAALTAAAAYITIGILGMIHPQDFTKTIDYVHEWVFVVALLATSLALIMVIQATSGMARIGAWSAAIGHLMLVPAAALTAIRGIESWDLLFLVGMLCVVVGYLILAIADVRRRLIPRGLGLLLAIGWVAAIPLDVAFGAGGLVLGASWAGVAKVLRAPVESPVAQPVH